MDSELEPTDPGRDSAGEFGASRGLGSWTGLGSARSARKDPASNFILCMKDISSSGG